VRKRLRVRRERQLEMIAARMLDQVRGCAVKSERYGVVVVAAQHFLRVLGIKKWEVRP